MVQYRVFLTGSRRGAIATGKIVRHYGGKVVAFNREKVELPNYVTCALEDPAGLEATYAGFLHVQLRDKMFRIIVS